MAKLFIRRQPDGTFNLRAERLAGKTLAGNAVKKGIKREDLATEAEKLLMSVAPPLKPSTPV